MSITRDDLESEEVDSIEKFITLLLEDERTEAFPGEIQALSFILNRPYPEVLKECKEKGIGIKLHSRNKIGRGFSANDHDRFSEKNGNIIGEGIGNTSRFMVNPFHPK